MPFRSEVVDLAAVREARQAERRAIYSEVLALARRADAAGMPIAGYMLDMVALEAGWDGLSLRPLTRPQS